MWSAPKLRDMNLSMNLLSTLPNRPHQTADSAMLDPPTDEDDSLGPSDGSSSNSTPKSTPRAKPKPVSVTSSVSTSSVGNTVSGGEEEEGSVVGGGGGGGGGRRGAGHEGRAGLSLDKHGNVITCLRQRELRHHSLWTQAVQVTDTHLLLQAQIIGILSCVCFFLLFHPCCSHARGILCGIHTLCMGSPFPAVHARLSLIF